MWKTAVLEEQSASHWGCQLGSPSASSLELHTNKQSTVVSFSLGTDSRSLSSPEFPLQPKHLRSPDGCVHLISSCVSIVSPVTIYNQHRFQFVIEAGQYSAAKGSESDVHSVTVLVNSGSLEWLNPITFDPYIRKANSWVTVKGWNGMDTFFECIFILGNFYLTTFQCTLFTPLHFMKIYR